MASTDKRNKKKKSEKKGRKAEREQAQFTKDIFSKYQTLHTGTQHL